MINDFLKLNIVENLKQNNLTNIILNNENFVLLNHNLENLKDILDFINFNNEQVLIVNGFMNCGKTCLTSFVVNNLLNDYIISFKINFNGLYHIDDIYVQIYNYLIKYHNEHKISMKKSTIKEFSQKILNYVLDIKQPIIFVFDFDENINDVLTKELLVFINELVTKQKNKNLLKIIINSLSFNFDLLSEFNFKYSNTIIRPFSSNNIRYELFDINKSNPGKPFYNSYFNLSDCEFFYEITRGHYIYIEFIKILEEKHNIPIHDFLSQYKNQNLYILDYIISKLMGKYYNKFRDFFIFLTLNKLKSPIQFLYENNFINKDNLNILLSNKLVKKENNTIYIKSYIKKYVLNNTDDESKFKITNLLLNIYKNQLELSPLKRELKISRASLHHEIEYHNNFLNNFKEKVRSQDKNIALASISYARSQGVITTDKINKKNKNDFDIEKNNKTRNINENKISPVELTREEQLLLTSSFNTSLKDKINFDKHNIEKNDNEQETLKKNEIIDNNQIENLFKTALEYEKKLEYYKAIDIYNLILDKDLNEEDKKLVYTYTKLGMLYQKLSNYKKALNLYKKAIEICVLKNETIKTYYIYSQIAKIYKAIFKNDLAKEIYNKILNDKKNMLPNDLRIETTNDYVEIIKEPKSVIEILLKIKNIVDNSENNDLKIEYYYKLATGFDDIDDISKAKEYYFKCLEHINKDTNSKNSLKYTGTIYYNLGNISLYESKNNEKAYEYFKLSLKFEAQNNNYEEAYFASINLGKMLLYKRSNEAYVYFKEAISYANKLNDKFYLAESQLNLGDYFYFIKNDEEALKCFLLVLSIAIKNNFSPENIENVKSRLKDLKIRLGEEKFSLIANKSKSRGID